MVILAITFGMGFFPVVGNLAATPVFTGYIRFLGAGDFIFSLIMALPVLGGVIQVAGAYLLEITGRRKPLFLLSGFIHRLAFIPVALIPFLYDEASRSRAVWPVAVLISIAATGHSLTSISFMSWMGDLVPEESKGRFFSKRTMISTGMGAIAGLSAGFAMDHIQGLSGFATVILIAAAMGALDILMFFWVKEPRMISTGKAISLPRMFLIPFKDRNYFNFTAFACLWMFGINVASPFFNIYLLENMGLNYTSIYIAGPVLSSLVTILFIRKWGNLTDRYGSRMVMFLCSCVQFFLPLFWLFATPGRILIIMIANSLSGIFWPGFEMAQLNLSIWSAPPKNRPIYMANFALIIAVFGTALAYICGGAFVEIMKGILEGTQIRFFFGQTLNAFHLLFILSGMIRLAALVFLFKGFKEPNRPDLAESLGSLHQEFYQGTRKLIAKIRMKIRILFLK